MKLIIRRLLLPLLHEFKIAYGSLNHQSSVIVELADGAHRGFGEAVTNHYYGHSFDSLTASLANLARVLDEASDATPAAVRELAAQLLPSDPFARAAVDSAAHDLEGKQRGLRTFENLGLAWPAAPESSFTIGIAAIDEMVAKLHEQPGWRVYKIKIGTPEDVEAVRELRRHTDAVFRVDANCGWTVDEAIAKSRTLADLGVEFIEQPLPAETPRADQLRLFKESALPLIADESCRVEADVDSCVGLFHGINVKITKCGGITPAVAMLRRARSHGMRTMVGCMVESSIGISAAAQVLPLVDYADLDGAVLLREDPATGVRIHQGSVSLPSRTGNGCELIEDLANRLAC